MAMLANLEAEIGWILSQMIRRFGPGLAFFTRMSFNVTFVARPAMYSSCLTSG